MKCTHNDCGVCYAAPLSDTSSTSGMCDTPQDCPMYLAQQVKTLAEEMDIELSIKQPPADMLRDYFGLDDAKQYRILEEGEIIKEGDEVLIGEFWRSSQRQPGGIIHGQACYRRPLANEYNIAASMEPVSPIDAVANAPSEWPDEYQSWLEVPLSLREIAEAWEYWSFHDEVLVFINESDNICWCWKTDLTCYKTYTKAQWQNARALYEQSQHSAEEVAEQQDIIESSAALRYTIKDVVALIESVEDPQTKGALRFQLTQLLNQQREIFKES